MTLQTLIIWLYFFGVSDIAADTLSAYKLWRMRKRPRIRDYMVVSSQLLMGFVIFQLATFIAGLDRLKDPVKILAPYAHTIPLSSIKLEYTMWFTLWIIGGRMVLSFVSWHYALWLVGQDDDN